MKTLILVRHAHRKTLLGRSVDNGLSKRGRTQAKALASFGYSKFKGTPPTFWSSPKLRCIETLLPLTEKFECDLERFEFLNEGGDLKKKAKELLVAWRKSQSSLVVAASHGDVIPFFLDTHLKLFTDLDKGAWVEITDGNPLRLRELIQEFPKVWRPAT